MLGLTAHSDIESPANNDTISGNLQPITVDPGLEQWVRVQSGDGSGGGTTVYVDFDMAVGFDDGPGADDGATAYGAGLSGTGGWIKYSNATDAGYLSTGGHTVQASAWLHLNGMPTYTADSGQHEHSFTVQ